MHIHMNLYVYAEVVIGFEETLVTTPESGGVVELCSFHHRDQAKNSLNNK